MSTQSLRFRGNVRFSKKRWCIMWLWIMFVSLQGSRQRWLNHWFPGLICPGKGQGYMCKRVNTSDYKSIFANWILWAVTLVSLMTPTMVITPMSSPYHGHPWMWGQSSWRGGACLSGEDLSSGPLLKLIKQVLHLDHCSTKCVPGGK